ncbi:MAG: sugar O-acyltransferase [Alphaproteobacteria bacterium]|nr:MAG: sugar O-acyltransferase [Alphaproteobacteria bacterium]
MKIAIFGASGLGREVADICADTGYTDIVFLVKDQTEECLWQNKVFEDTPEIVKRLRQEGYKFAVGIGDPTIRRIIVEKYPDLDYPNLTHTSATFGQFQRGSLESSRGVIIAAGCRITNNIDFGDFILLNLNVTVGHDTIIGDFVSAMPSANISGNVDVKSGVYIGTGSAIIHGGNDVKLIIGEGSVVGAGAVVTKDVPSGVTVVGIPAKPLNKT